jgi:hypothetical protein
MTRTEHLQWCKDRAHEYLNRGDITNGVSSMLSDMEKHDGTKGVNPMLEMMGLMAVQTNDLEAARRFVTGFN